MLNHLYPDLQPADRETDIAPTPVEMEGAASGLSDEAYLIIPPHCAASGARCALHLVLHGCGQSSEQIGETFIRDSGFLPWAANNNIVLAFPQVTPGATNPLACWDWWGYTGANYIKRDGAQLKLLADWVKALAGQ
jgi:poly(3-hydroxybutyrate) depolymerase